MHKDSLTFLRLKSCPRCISVIQVGKDWHVHYGWGMVNVMHNVILATTNHVVQNMSWDEITTIDNHS